MSGDPSAKDVGGHGDDAGDVDDVDDAENTQQSPGVGEIGPRQKPRPCVMPTFIDESGDTGPDDQCSDEFHLAAVWFETFDEALACQDAINQLKGVLKRKQSMVFHSAETPHTDQLEFYRCVASHKFYFSSCTIRKRDAIRKGIELTKELVVSNAADIIAASFHEHYLIAEATKGTPLNERVVIHHHNNKEYIDIIKKSFTQLKSARATGAPLVKKVSTERAESEILVQLADMVCNAVRRSFDGDGRYLKLIAARKNHMGDWP